MSVRLSVRDAIDALARDPLRHVVLLKQLRSYPDPVQIHRACGAAGTAMLVALDVAVSAYDRHAYRRAAMAAFVSSDHPDLTASLLPPLPGDAGIVFKLSQETDPEPISSSFALTPTTRHRSACPGDRPRSFPDDHPRRARGLIAARDDVTLVGNLEPFESASLQRTGVSILKRT
ncbi:MAG: hypothetical protein U1E60_17095 [Reyranellaceae bacterium]